MLLSTDTVKVFAVLAVPYILFFVYLLVTQTLFDFYHQAVAFNQKFYIYNYPRPDGVTTVNPIRYAIVIAQNFHNNFSSLLISVKDFNFHFPFNITLAVANTALLIYLLLKRRFGLALFLFLVLIYANVRTNPLESGETDYQSSVYILISFFNMVFLLPKLYHDINRTEDFNKKLIFSGLLLLVGIYAFFNTAFLLRKYTEKTYLKYMGMQALIYNRPDIAPIINTVVDKNDYMWIGPFEFENLFYAEGQIPSEYMILLPEFAKSPEIQNEMMSDFNEHKPKVMYFDKTYSIRGHFPENYAQFFLDFLDDHYITLAEYREGGTRYQQVQPVTIRMDLETKLFIRKDVAEEVIQKLVASGYIKRIEE